MGKFDKNLKVRSKNISFYSTVWHFFSPLFFGVPKERKMRFWVREKHERSARKEEGKCVPLLASPSRAVSRINFLPFPFELLPRRLAIIKLSYNHINLPS